MTHSFKIKATLAIAALAVVGAFAAPETASAKSGRMYESQNYKFKKPMHGYDGQASGGYYCTYVRIPNRKCTYKSGREVCKVKGWTLRQECR